MNNNTFYALSTPPGFSAISTVRISGSKSLETIKSLTKKNNGSFKSGKTVLCNIYIKNNKILDSAVVVFYKKPRSYTGEDMVEINTHGNPIITSQLFKKLSKLGLRLANPGEFTLTAFLNNKIDLVQAENVSALIGARTKEGVSLALRNSLGKASNKFRGVRNRIINTLALVEYELDNTDTTNLNTTLEQVKKEVEKTIKTIKNLLKHYSLTKTLIKGPRVVITGKPNVGKSTIFNFILNRDRAIVASTPGTTRDVIDATCDIKDLHITLVDTAGTRETDDLIEKIGVRKSKKETKSADLILYVSDKKPEEIKTKNKALLVVNKIDEMSVGELTNLKQSYKKTIFVSAKKGVGFSKLKKEIYSQLKTKTQTNQNMFIASERQKNILSSALKLLKKSNKKLISNELELVSYDLKVALSCFDDLLGKTTANDVLDVVFSGFCVGK